MERIEIYHTIEDRNNDAYILSNGPFKCTIKNHLNDKKTPWLGDGYYFWEDLQDSKNWGKYAHYAKWIVCRSAYDFDNKNFLDLANHPTHIHLFREWCDMLCSAKENYRFSVLEVLQFVKDELGDTFPYKAVRSYSTRVRENGYIIPYNPYKKKWNEVYPSPYIQICVWDKDAFLIENLQIIEKHP